MNTTEVNNKHFNRGKRGFGPSLAVNLIVPFVLYRLLRTIFTNDTIPLAITAAIPAVRTLAMWALKRKTDWIGILGIISFTVALVVSALSGGSTLPLKLTHPIISGAIGLIFLISALINKPLMITLIRLLSKEGSERLQSPLSRRKYTLMTALFGGIILIGSIIHIIIALTFPTGSFVALANLVSMITIFSLIACGRLVAARLRY